eukprot:scaffold259468_cov16-Prasinocladus_malaysianus.AAC.1
MAAVVCSAAATSHQVHPSQGCPGSPCLVRDAGSVSALVPYVPYDVSSTYRPQVLAIVQLMPQQTV